MGPLSAETEIVFAHPNVRAALFDETAGTMTVVAPESSLVPADLIGVPLVIATAPGSFISFEGIDLRGVARVDMIATALSAFMEGGRIEIRQGDVDGTLIDSVKVESRATAERAEIFGQPCGIQRRRRPLFRLPTTGSQQRAQRALCWHFYRLTS